MGLFGRARRLTISLSGERPWRTPSGALVRCDPVGEGPPDEMAGVALDDEQAGLWALLEILEPEPAERVWVREGSDVAIGPEVWRVVRIADAGIVSGVNQVAHRPFSLRQPGRLVTLERDR
jgi:hypothetical protein